MLHEVGHRERLGLPGLLEWLRSERRAAATSNERTRRLDTDARAVQFVTIHASKGLQYPVVHLPLAFDKWAPEETIPLFHDEEGRRTLDVGGLGDSSAAAGRARAELAGEELRLTYVALTRAQSQVVVWWAPTWNAGNSGLTRLLLGRGPGGSRRCPTPSRAGPRTSRCWPRLTQWQERQRAVAWRSPSSAPRRRVGRRRTARPRSAYAASTATWTPTGGVRRTPG